MAALAMDTPSPMDPALCGAKNRQGNPCSNRAGKGTSHVGFGRCSNHGGKTQSGEMHAAKLAAIAAMPQGGGDSNVNPLDAMLYTVHRASGLSMWYRALHESRLLANEDPEPFASLEMQALGKMNEWAKGAVQAGVAERQVRIAERMGERLSAAFEAAIGALVAVGVELTGDQRMLAVRTYAGELARHEGGGDIQASAKDA